MISTASGKTTPFWFVSNQHGQHTLEQPALLEALIITSFSEKNDRILTWDFGVKAVGGRNTTKDLWLQEGWIGINYKHSLRLFAGKKENASNTPWEGLTSGDLLWSSNARPFPMIEAGTQEFTDLPFFKKHLQVKAGLAHGWLEADRYVKNAYVHSKYINLRSKLSGRFNIQAGMHHVAQWGGTSPDHGNLPDGLDELFRIILVTKGCDDAPVSDQINKCGNHLGSRTLLLTYDLTDNKTIGASCEDVFEDGSGFRKKNFPDGLYRIYFHNNQKRPLITTLLYEFLYTCDQSRPVHDPENGLGGDDNYFNHGTYKSGWTYYGMTIGTPLITSIIFNDQLIKDNKAVPDVYGHLLLNTRVVAHHIGISGFLTPALQYRAMGTYSVNKETFGNPLKTPPYKQASGRLDLEYHQGRSPITFSLSIAADKGEWLENCWGIKGGIKIVL